MKQVQVVDEIKFANQLILKQDLGLSEGAQSNDGMDKNRKKKVEEKERWKHENNLSQYCWLCNWGFLYFSHHQND